SGRRRHTRWPRDWSSDVCSSDLPDGRFVLTATLNLLGDGTIQVVDTATDTLVESLRCEPGCHGANFGPKLGGGFYGYVSSQFTRSEERRVGKECECGCTGAHEEN